MWVAAFMHTMSSSSIAVSPATMAAEFPTGSLKMVWPILDHNDGGAGAVEASGWLIQPLSRYLLDMLNILWLS
jgi:hypothetical protein